MTSNELERVIDRARSERARHLLTVCTRAVARLMRRIGQLAGLVRESAPKRPAATR